MGFAYEPCPWCSSTAIKQFKSSHEFCRVRCLNCDMQLMMSGKSMMDCARTWNMRASRRAEMKKQNMSLVSLLHADIANGSRNNEAVSLDNSDEMWNIASAAMVAWDMDAKPVRPEHEIKIGYEVLFSYLDALVQESAEKVAEPNLEPEKLF